MAAVAQNLNVNHILESTCSSSSSSSSACDAGTYRVPEFVHRYEAVQCMNPLTVKAREETYKWFLGTGMDAVLGPRKWKRFLDSDFPALMGLVNPTADYRGFLLSCIYDIVAFALDDYVDVLAAEKNPEALYFVFLQLTAVMLWHCPEDDQLHEIFEQVLDYFPVERRESGRKWVETVLEKARKSPNAEWVENLLPTPSGWRDCFDDLFKIGKLEAYVRLAQCTQRYFLSNLREAHEKKRHVIPTLEEYIDNRRHSVCLEPHVALLDMTYDADPLPNSIFYSPPFQRLLEAMNDIIAWHNDLYSFVKEIRVGEVNNLVFLLSKIDKCSYQQAANKALAMISTRINDFEGETVLLRQQSPSHLQATIELYISNCKDWIRATDAFHKYSIRYPQNAN